MRKGDRREHDFHDKARHQQHPCMTRHPPQPALLARAEQPARRRKLIEGDDRGHGGEAHLDAGADDRRLIASRPSASPPITSSAAMQLRTVGTSAPVSSV